MLKISALLLFATLSIYNLVIKPTVQTERSKPEYQSKPTIYTGAEQTEKYLPYLKGKKIGILGNQTTMIGKTHLVDSLKALGIKIEKVFGPEHGFRGNASA